MKKVHIIGGGTFGHVRNHLAIAMPAFGTTARKLETLCKERFKDMAVELHLTKMAEHTSNLVTNLDIRDLVLRLRDNLDTKVVFMNAALCDFEASIMTDLELTKSGKYEERLKSNKKYAMALVPDHKLLPLVRLGRKDICLVAFKTTCGATAKEQYIAGLKLLKENSCNLVLANDVKTRLNMIITPEEAIYHETIDRDECLKQLVDMTYYRSHLSFTRSTVVSGHPVPWSSAYIYDSLKEVVNYCISKNAYKPFNGATVGHFACKIAPTEFLTSIRKSNFNDLSKNGLVRIKTDGPDNVIAYGKKPSVGGQSQRIIFSDHDNYDCIVHFHCPIKSGSKVPVVSQREYECGSHECGENTSKGLKKFGNLSAVMLDNHGPNIVFHHSINPKEVIEFIEENFDLSDKTGGTF